MCACVSLICLHQLSEWKMSGLPKLLVLPLSSLLSLCLSLPLFTGNVMLSAHICLSAVEGGRVRGCMGVGWRGHRHMGSLRLFSVAVDTCLLACAPLTFPFNPSSFPISLSLLLSSLCLGVWITTEAPLS